MAELSPMMKQYQSIKDSHRDELLFFRVGDFYEMFFDDAVTASRELELTLTGKDCGQEKRAPMCGVPFHNCDAYIARLIAKGYKVAICDQTEDPALAKGLVKREIIRVVTPGTVTEGVMLDESKNNYIASVYCEKSNTGLAFADVSTGEVSLTELDTVSLTEIMAEIERYTPSEIIFPESFEGAAALKKLVYAKMTCMMSALDDGDFADGAADEQFGEKARELDLHIYAKKAVGGILSYLHETQKQAKSKFTGFAFYIPESFMNLDITARRNLELSCTMRGGEKRGSLLYVLDKTKTAMGKRMLRKTVERPLLSMAQITRRHNAVNELFSDSVKREHISELTDGIFDLERLATRVVYGTITPKEMQTLGSTLVSVAPLREMLAGSQSSLLCELADRMDTLEDIIGLIGSCLAENLPSTFKDGKVIAPGVSRELDELRDILSGGKDYLTKIEEREKQATGIKTLKVSYNKVFGYYIEVSNMYREKVPDTYIRKQTLTNGERFITEELKQLEGKILSAKERSLSLEISLFDELRKKVSLEYSRIATTAEAVAMADMICSFACVAVNNHYVMPEMNTTGEICIKEGRHPVIETLTDVPFVPNDTLLDNGENNIAIITGPNMAGKSTYMRQVALIVLMAQIGSFVPASSASLPLVDGIFTRVGASDDLASGQSTFMIEMSEVAQILKTATKNSLIILDEVGRGTSTFDGMSIARACVEAIADKKRLGAKTLFATHYHELSTLESEISGIKNYNIVARKRGDDIIFLRRIVRGGTDDSYGIEVAKLAGIPSEIIKRAKQILKGLEGGKTETRVVRDVQDTSQISLEDLGDRVVADKLRETDVDVLTPREAINLLFELKQMAGTD